MESHPREANRIRSAGIMDSSDPEEPKIILEIAFEKPVDWGLEEFCLLVCRNLRITLRGDLHIECLFVRVDRDFGGAAYRLVLIPNTIGRANDPNHYLHFDALRTLRNEARMMGRLWWQDISEIVWGWFLCPEQAVTVPNRTYRPDLPRAATPLSSPDLKTDDAAVQALCAQFEEFCNTTDRHALIDSTE